MTMDDACHLIDVHQLASVVKNRLVNVLVIDSRCFTDYNISHVSSAVNVCCSKIVKRRLQQDKLSVKELLTHTCNCDLDDNCDVVVYDQCSKDWTTLPSESFTAVLLSKLQKSFHGVNLLSGGFSEFQHLYPELCGDKVRKLPPLSSLSQPCLPIADQGPTKILPFLYLGSQFDALNKELLKDHNITYELNVSTSCPKPDFLPDAHFMRISVNDNYSEKLLPHFPDAFRFLDKVRESSCCVLVHCLAGISRSPTVAIAYVMRYLRLTSDDGYRYVKSKRPTISPNFNFLGQLLEFEKQLRKEKILDLNTEECTTPPIGGKKRLCKTDMRKTAKLTLSINTEFNFNSNSGKTGDQSPTTALAKLSFSGPPTPEVSFAPGLHHSRSFESMMDQIASSRDHGPSGSKILSPVKEIKCESLISEISFGCEGGSKTRIQNTSPWQHNRVHRSENSRSTFYQVFQKEGESFSKSSMDVHEAEAKSHSLLKHVKREFKFPSGFDSPWLSKETVKSEKSTIRTLLRKSTESSTSKSYITEAPSGLFPLYLCSQNPYSRSDSTTTSGFGSESSDFLEDAGRPSKIEFDIDELEDDVMLKSAEATGRKKNETTRFPFTLPEVHVSPGLQSPLSPSESHLLEDNFTNTSSSLQKSTSTSPTASLDDSDGQLDSGVSSSPWPWSRKRTAPFDDSSPFDQIVAPSDLCRENRKHELSIQSRCNRTASCSNTDRTYSVTNNELTSCDSMDIGLYRVQSCPGMSFMESLEKTHLVSGETYTPFMRRKTATNDRNLHRHSIGNTEKLFVREVPASGSCPDVLQVAGPQSTPSSPHHRDFRKNVRLIRVS